MDALTIQDWESKSLPEKIEVLKTEIQNGFGFFHPTGDECAGEILGLIFDLYLEGWGEVNKPLCSTSTEFVRGN